MLDQRERSKADVSPIGIGDLCQSLSISSYSTSTAVPRAVMLVILENNCH